MSGGVFQLNESTEDVGDSLARGGRDGENLGVRIDGENGILLHFENVIVDALAFGQGDNFRTLGEVGIALEFAANHSISVAGIVIIDINEMKEGGGAVDVAKESVAEALAVGGTFDKAGDVSDKEVLIVDSRDAELGSEGREGIIGNLGTSVRNARKEGGLAGVWQTDEANISEELQLESRLEGIARFANFGNERGLTSGRFEVGIAKTAVAALGNDSFLLVDGKVGEDFFVALDNSADRDFDDEIFSGAAGRALTGAVFAVFGG